MTEMTIPYPFHAELRKDGKVIARGPAVGVFGGGEPGVITFERGIYVRTEGVTGRGTEPTYRVYEWAPHGMMRGTCEELLEAPSAEAV